MAMSGFYMVSSIVEYAREPVKQLMNWWSRPSTSGPVSLEIYPEELSNVM
jgi:hypothetical protein